MGKRFVERIEALDNRGQVKYNLDLYEDSECLKDTAYALKAFKTLSALRKVEGLNFNGLEVYTALIPECKPVGDKMPLFSGFIHPSPKKQGDYWIVIDERLNPEQRVAAIVHELSHLSGGFNNDEHRTQKVAIKTLTELVTSYDTLNRDDAKSTISRQVGVDFDVGYRPRESLKKSLQYLVDTRGAFGIDDKDLSEAGIRRARDMKGYSSLILFILGLLFISTNITGNVILSNDYKTGFNIFGIILLMMSFIIGICKLSNRAKVFRNINI